MQVIKDLQTKLLFSGAVRFGSKVLCDNYRDEDFVIVRANWDKVTNGTKYSREANVSNYFSVIPPYGGSLIKFDGVDVIVLEEQSHVVMVKKSVKYLQDNYSKQELSIKDFRVKVFEEQL